MRISKPTGAAISGRPPESARDSDAEPSGLPHGVCRAWLDRRCNVATARCCTDGNHADGGRRPGSGGVGQQFAAGIDIGRFDRGCEHVVRRLPADDSQAADEGLPARRRHWQRPVIQPLKSPQSVTSVYADSRRMSIYPYETVCWQACC